MTYRYLNALILTKNVIRLFPFNSLLLTINIRTSIQVLYTKIYYILYHPEETTTRKYYKCFSRQSLLKLLRALFFMDGTNIKSPLISTQMHLYINENHKSTVGVHFNPNKKKFRQFYLKHRVVHFIKVDSAAQFLLLVKC